MAAPRAAKTSGSIDMAQFLNEIRGGDIRSVYLFEGTEENFKRESLRQLEKAAVAEGMEALNGVTLTAPSADDIMAAADTLPFMGGRRFVLVRDYAGLPKGKKTDAPAAADRAPDTPLADYLAHAPSSAVIVFYVVGKLGGTNRLVTAIQTAGRRVSFERLTGQALQGWVVKQFSALGKTCSPDMAQRLIFTCGEDSGTLKTEIGKLAAYAGSRADITAEDISAVATRTEECTVFEMIDDLIANRQAQAWGRMRDMLRSGGSRFQLLSMLLRQFRLMQQIKILQFDQVPQPAWAAKLGISPWQAELYSRQAKPFSGRQIRDAVNLCLETEYACKSGKMNEEGSLESVMLKLFAMRAE